PVAAEDVRNLKYGTRHGRWRLRRARGQFVSEDPVFWGKQNIFDPQSFNVYSYSEGNPINKRDPNGRDADYTGAIAVPIFEFLSLGPTGGLVVDPTTDDPMVYLGVTATPKPGVSGGVYYAPTPSEGWSVSGSIPPAGQISVSREKGKLTTSGEVGYSYPPGVGVS